VMSASVGYLVIDSINPSALAPFWCAMLDTAVDTTLGEGEAAGGSSPEPPVSWKGSPGAALPIPKATSSTSTCYRPPDLRVCSM
jgi:hypothetical protein